MKHLPVIVGLGEVLWDVFPDGPRFGGAPANFACSAAALGQDQFDVMMASAVGIDELGRLAIEALREHHVKIAAVKQVEYQTGQVHVKIDHDGHASYEFASDTAWDHLEWCNSFEELAKRTDVVCFGTLAQRSDVSRQTIKQFIASTPTECLRLLDVNLRPPFWNDEVVVKSLAMANALKLNDAELPIIASILGFRGSDEEVIQQIMTRYTYKIIALTCGAKGSLLLRETGECSDLAGQPVEVVDTVGAGDAFTACLAIGLLRSLPLATINRWANQVAAFVCTQPGATPHLPKSLCLPEVVLR
jgi:fructokinase